MKGTTPKKKTVHSGFDYKYFLFFGLIVLAVFFAVLYEKCPSPGQIWFFHIIISIGIAGLAASLPGFINIKYKNMVSAGGSLAVFFIVYFMEPAKLVVSDNCTEAFTIVAHIENESGNNQILQNQRFGLRIGYHNIDPKSINEYGEVTFDNISHHYIGDSIYLRPVNPIIKVVSQSNYTTNVSKEITFKIKIDNIIRGSVKIDDQYVENVLLIFDNKAQIRTNEFGRYEISLDKYEGESCEVQIIYNDREQLRRQQIITSQAPINFFINTNS